MRRVAVAALLVLLAACGGGSDPAGAASRSDPTAASCDAVTVPGAIPSSPLVEVDGLGPLSDVSCDWQHYQAAAAFCVKPDAGDFTPGGTGADADGSDPACAFSGFGAGDKNLYKVQVAAPPLCAGCRRYFIDLSRASANAKGHAFYAIASFNPSYAVDPFAHSPNTKNFTNDALLAPPGTAIQALIGMADLYDKAYVTDTVHFVHNLAQGDYYAGPWYVNGAGERIHGVYLDVNAGAATSLRNATLDGLRYLAGYDDGTLPCPDGLIPQLSDADFLYAGCVDHIAASGQAYDPLQ